MNIVVLTGAGISAESGLATFRDADGLWEGHRVEDVATPEGFAADPDLVHDFYDARRAALDLVEPNAAHRALALLERRWRRGPRRRAAGHAERRRPARPGRVVRRAAHARRRCVRRGAVACDAHAGVDRQHQRGAACPVVRRGGAPARRRVVRRGAATGSTGSTGRCAAWTSSSPWAPRARSTRPRRSSSTRCARRAHTVELNLAPSEGSWLFRDSRLGPATELVPTWVEEMLDR